eukprot:scaffold5849_cov120-Skeletonema_dohrnii-CCMP3373.AAC.4
MYGSASQTLHASRSTKVSSGEKNHPRSVKYCSKWRAKRAYIVLVANFKRFMHEQDAQQGLSLLIFCRIWHQA